MASAVGLCGGDAPSQLAFSWIRKCPWLPSWNKDTHAQIAFPQTPSNHARYRIGQSGNEGLCNAGEGRQGRSLHNGIRLRWGYSATGETNKIPISRTYPQSNVEYGTNFQAIASQDDEQLS